MKKPFFLYFFLSISAGLVIILPGSQARSEGKNHVGIEGGAAVPSNGSGWATDNLETGWSARADYCRMRWEKLGLCVDARYLHHPVDTSGTTAEDEDVSTDTYGAGVGFRYRLLERERLSLCAGAGAGFYNSELLSDSNVEDTSSGTGLDISIKAAFNASSLVSIGLRADYLMLFMGEGASFDDLAVTGGLGFRF